MQLSELKKKWARLRHCNHISEDTELEDYLEINEGIATAEYPTDADILDSLIYRNNAKMRCIPNNSMRTTIL